MKKTIITAAILMSFSANAEMYLLNITKSIYDGKIIINPDSNITVPEVEPESTDFQSVAFT